MDIIAYNIVSNPFDITYFAIGSAKITDINQQFPPFLEKIYHSTNKKIRIINIDLEFESPYFLSEYLQSYDKNRIEYHYLKERLEFDNQGTLDVFNFLNTIIMDQNNLLLVSDYTGRGLSDYEKYFYNLYKNTAYKNKFNKLICYDFNYDDSNTCIINFEKNFPIIKNNEFVKIVFNDKNEFIELIKNHNEFTELIKKKFICELKRFMAIDLYAYRNIINNNITNEVANAIKLSIFDNLIDKITIKNKLKEKLFDYYQIAQLLFTKNISNILNNILNEIDNTEPYHVCNQYSKVINLISI